tara:strand:- start:335 stop:1453 length:1119 start_codon:yes stop_codon:yes gene_type:complete
MIINFNEPLILPSQKTSLLKILNSKLFSGNGSYTKKCENLLSKKMSGKTVMMTNSCTSALEMSALLLDIKSGDEVIMPSFTFVSTANAFVLRGAKIVFVDIEQQSMNIDPSLIESAITKKTKAVVCVHYGGFACDLEKLLKICRKHNIHLIEDAAHAIGAYYKGKPLGTFGSFGCISFHDTKNIHSGEGGALIINDEKYTERAEIIREKGTNRSAFFRGMVDKYRWIDKGSSYLMSEINACFLVDQLKALDKINNKRLRLWSRYYQNLKNTDIELPPMSKDRIHNGHNFFIKSKSLNDRKEVMRYLSKRKIYTSFHYIPLHESKKTRKYYRFNGDDSYTTTESEKLLRMPMHYNLKVEHVDIITKYIREFYG